MTVNDDDADVFAIPDFWGSSSWLSPPPEATNFFSLDVNGMSSPGVGVAPLGFFD
ncbi:hypothetical protein IMZ48_36720 [Candidatus Bathyarchaeota archaeon]|nr:hypothetical protein [Candidatus Bathyarchaeota archaeon]